MADIKQLKDFPIITKSADNAYLIVEENGVAKKIPLHLLPTANVDLTEVNGRLDVLSEEIANLQTSGLTTAQVNALDGMFKIASFTADPTAAYSAFKVAFGIEDSGEDEPDEPEVTLTSISATYSGGDVAVGTALTDLTGIVVTATYSDGSTAAVTGYTLSGEIAEGSNTITVTYQGKTATFTVNGAAEEEPVTALRGHALPDSPTSWSSNENWKHGSNGSVIGSLAQGSTTSTTPGWAYIAYPFTGTVYVRSLGSATKTYYSYTDYMIIADDETAIQNPSYDTLSTLKCSEATSIFEIDGIENQQFVVKKDGSYEQKTGTHVSISTSNNEYGVVVIQKFEIPEGKIGYLCVSKLHNDNATANNNSRWLEGVNAVFFENPYSNPTATVQEVTE